MKQAIPYCLLMIGICHSASSQIDSSFRFRKAAPSFQYEVQQEIDAVKLAHPNDSAEGGPVNKLMRWQSFMSSRVSNDVPLNYNITAPLNKAIMSYSVNHDIYCTNGGKYAGAWQCLGPFRTDKKQHQGRVNSIWVNPLDTNIILLGGDGGGLWKSYNAGQTWRNITDNPSWGIPAMLGVNNIAVSPLDINDIYISLGIGSQYYKSAGYGVGLAVSTDGGENWVMDEEFLTVVGNSTPDVREVAFDPEMQSATWISAITPDRIYTKYSGSITPWDNITPNGPGDIHKYTDMEYMNGKLLVATNATNNIAQLCIYDLWTGWSVKNISPPTGYYMIDDEDGLKHISSNNVNDSLIFAIRMHRSSDDAVRILILRSKIDMIDFTVLSNNFFNGGVYIEKLEVAKNNPDIIYIPLYWLPSPYQQPCLIQSVDGGYTYTNASNDNHADGRAIYMHYTDNSSGGIGNVFYLGTDGGIAKKRWGESFPEDITGDSLCITEFYGLGNSELDDRIVMAGSQDNNLKALVKNIVIPWKDVGSGDYHDVELMVNGDIRGLTGNTYSQGIAEVAFNKSLTQNVPITPSDTTGAMGYTDGPNYLEDRILYKPIYFSPYNQQYVGYEHVWQRENPTIWPSMASIPWDEAFTKDPIDVISNSEGQLVVDFHIDESVTNKSYVAYMGAYDNGSFTQKLCVSTNTDNLPAPQWDNITPPEVQYSNINTIAVDPNNFDRIWVGLGNINNSNIYTAPADMTKRVMYSDDRGTTWHDVSKGLSALPVNKLFYVKGSDDLIFAGTDVGMFRFNKARQEWECFNDGLPPCIVTDIEANYCSGKLQISTYGRGVWETPIYENEWIIPTGDATIITTNTTWNREQYMQGNIRVKAGKKLTIENGSSAQTVIHMPRNAKITVEPGGRLEVDGAKITNSCEDCFWYGIIAEGDKNVPQLGGTDPNHAIVEIKNDAIIEHARFAVNLIDGAFIRATESSFINNKKSISFVEYDYNNISAIKDCQFYINDNYKGHDVNYPFAAHITMWAVKGVNIAGCGFYNWDTHAQNKGKAHGIIAHDAGFKLVPFCTNTSLYPCPSYQQNIFHGFRNGVNISGGFENMYAPYITGAAFDSNTVGVRIVTKKYVTVINSTFNIGNGASTLIDQGDAHYLPQCAWNIGIYTNKSENFTIQENTFIGHTNPDLGSVGTMIVSSDIYNNTIYKCDFKDLTYGCISSRVNGEQWSQVPINGIHGLRYECNSFNSNGHDIHIGGHPNYNPVAGVGLLHGIAAVQDKYVNSSTVLAPSNTFVGSTMNIHNEGHTFVYTYGTNPAENPALRNGAMSIWGGGNTNSCPSKFSDAPLQNSHNPFTLPVVQMKVAWDSTRLKRDTAYTNYMALLDNGSTSTLVSYISGATWPNTSTLLSTLLGYSPYLSKYAIQATIPFFDTTEFQTIVSANPDLLRDEEVYAYLHTEMSPPLSEWYLDKIATQRNTITQRGKDEMYITSLSAEMSELATNIIIATRLDTVETLNDTLAVWYRKLNSRTGEYDLVGHYLALKDTTRAQEVCDSIPLKFSLTVDDARYHVDYNSILQIAKGVIADGRSFDKILKPEMDALNDVINGGTYEIGIFAQKVWGPSTEQPDPPAPAQFKTCMDDGWVFERKAPPTTNPGYPVSPFSQLSTDNPYLKVAPNPARDLVHFNYSVPDAKGKLSILVMSTVGQTVKQFSIDNKKGVIDWDTNNVPPGTYIYKLNDNRGTITTGKLIIIK